MTHHEQWLAEARYAALTAAERVAWGDVANRPEWQRVCWAQAGWWFGVAMRRYDWAEMCRAADAREEGR